MLFLHGLLDGLDVYTRVTGAIDRAVGQPFASPRTPPVQPAGRVWTVQGLGTVKNGLVKHGLPICCASATNGAVNKAPRPVTKTDGSFNNLIRSQQQRRRDGRSYEGRRQGATTAQPRNQSGASSDVHRPGARHSSSSATTRAGADSVFHLAGSAITFTREGIWSRLVRFSIW